jgi:hypothetical protein
MNSPVTMLLQGLASSRRLMLDSVRDLSALELASRPSPALRSCVRLLGMSALADREVLRLLGVVNFPVLPAGFEVRFARWETGGNGEASKFDTALPEIFASHRNALLRATASLDAARFDEPVGPPDHLDAEGLFEFGTIGEMILAASAYTSSLAGEVAIVRLALGKAPVHDPFDASAALAPWG